VHIPGRGPKIGKKEGAKKNADQRGEDGKSYFYVVLHVGVTNWCVRVRQKGENPRPTHSQENKRRSRGAGELQTPSGGTRVKHTLLNLLNIGKGGGTEKQSPNGGQKSAFLTKTCNACSSQVGIGTKSRTRKEKNGRRHEGKVTRSLFLGKEPTFDHMPLGKVGRLQV